MANIITRREILLGVPEAWAAQYKEPVWRKDEHKTRITEALRNLVGTDYTEKQVDEIIGNTSWTSLTCDECGREVDSVLVLSTNDFYGVQVCQNCLKDFSRQLAEKDKEQ